MSKDDIIVCRLSVLMRRKDKPPHQLFAEALAEKKSMLVPLRIVFAASYKNCLRMKLFFPILLVMFLAACTGETETTTTVSDTTLIDRDTVVSQVPGPVVDTVYQEPPANEREPSPVSLNQQYTNKKNNFSLKHPADWGVTETVFAGRQPGINLFPKNRGIEKKTPLNVHADASVTYISVWPKGYGTELPSGASKKFNEVEQVPELSFAANKKESIVFYLKNGEPWAYFIVPERAPDNWKNGFVFAQVGIDNFSTTCYDKDTGKEKPGTKCDPMMGDRVVRSGNLKENDKRVIDKMLASFKLQ